VVKDALTDSSVFAYLAARFILALPPMAWFYGAALRKLSASDFRAGVRIGILMFGGYAFQTAGIAVTTPSKAAFITGFRRGPAHLPPSQVSTTLPFHARELPISIEAICW
jgi:hypothetical protein